MKLGRKLIGFPSNNRRESENERVESMKSGVLVLIAALGMAMPCRAQLFRNREPLALGRRLF